MSTRMLPLWPPRSWVGDVRHLGWRAAWAGLEKHPLVGRYLVTLVLHAPGKHPSALAEAVALLRDHGRQGSADLLLCSGPCLNDFSNDSGSSNRDSDYHVLRPA